MTQLLSWIDKLDALQSVLLMLEVVLLEVSRSVIIPILMIPVRTRQPVLCQTADTGGDRTSPARVSSWYLNYSGCRKSNIKMKIVEICKNLSKVVKYK